VLNELVSPSHALHGPNFSGSSIGPEAYKLQVAQFVRAFPDLRWEIEETVSEKDKVVVVWTFTGTHKGEYRGIAATNKKVSVDGITVHHITDGKIIGFLCELGYLGNDEGIWRGSGTRETSESRDSVKPRKAAR